MVCDIMDYKDIEIYRKSDFVTKTKFPFAYSDHPLRCLLR